MREQKHYDGQSARRMLKRSAIIQSAVFVFMTLCAVVQFFCDSWVWGIFFSAFAGFVLVRAYRCVKLYRQLQDDTEVIIEETSVSNHTLAGKIFSTACYVIGLGLLVGAYVKNDIQSSDWFVLAIIVALFAILLYRVWRKK